MRPSRIVLILVAILAGGLAAFLATRGDAPVKVVSGPEVVVEEEKTQILVAIAPIGMGERLSPKSVQWLDWPAGAVRPDYITVAASPDALEQVTGAVARFEIFPGDPILEQKLVRTEQGYLSAVLAKGMRGVSIAVTADSASGGFIVPNDHVDVVLTRQSQTGQVSETILHNVRVLAIGKRLGETGATGAQADPDDPRVEVFVEDAIATLELDPVQGETVINAAKVGTLSLVLRSIADFRPEDTELLRRPGNQVVRVIKYGQETNVMSGTSAAPAPQPVAVDPASYVELEPVPIDPVLAPSAAPEGPNPNPAPPKQ